MGRGERPLPKSQVTQGEAARLPAVQLGSRGRSSPPLFPQPRHRGDSPGPRQSSEGRTGVSLAEATPTLAYMPLVLGSPVPLLVASV